MTPAQREVAMFEMVRRTLTLTLTLILIDTLTHTVTLTPGPCRKRTEMVL